MNAGTTPYVAHAEDGMAVHAVHLLKREFGAEYVIVRGQDPTVHPTERFLFSANCTRTEDILFRNAFLRRVALPRDEDERGLIIPPFARKAKELIALRKLPIASLDGNFTEALRHLHFLQEGRWLGPRVHRPSWRSGRKARLREERAFVAL